jgi:hypothetical protein
VAQGILGVEDDIEEEFEVDINDSEPAFLKGQSAKSGVEVSPVKIVANPDGSLQARLQGCMSPQTRLPGVITEQCGTHISTGAHLATCSLCIPLPAVAAVLLGSACEWTCCE